jgi:hypothetical protein
MPEDRQTIGIAGPDRVVHMQGSTVGQLQIRLHHHALTFGSAIALTASSSNQLLDPHVYPGTHQDGQTPDTDEEVQNLAIARTDLG